MGVLLGLGSSSAMVFNPGIMRVLILLICGVVLLVAAVGFQYNAGEWATSYIADARGQGARFLRKDPETAKTYLYVGDQMRVIGIILISIAAFCWIREPGCSRALRREGDA